MTAYDKVLSDIRHLHEVFGLCFFLVTVNSEENFVDEFNEEKVIGNYGVWGIDKLTYDQCCTVVSHSRCDFMMKKVGGKLYSQRNWVLRMAPKLGPGGEEVKPLPVFKSLVRFSGCRYEHSLAHLNFYRSYFGVKAKVKNLDSFKNVEVVQYMTVDKKSKEVDRVNFSR